MSEMFVADPVKAQAAQTQVCGRIGHAGRGSRRGALPPRYRLSTPAPACSASVQTPPAFAFWSTCGQRCSPPSKPTSGLQALDVEMEYMFSTWFDVGFPGAAAHQLGLPGLAGRRKLIKYEAVHDIKSWADVKNRLDSDRRCYGFFPPPLAG